MGAHDVADVSTNICANCSSYTTHINANTGTNAETNATTNNKDTNAAPNAHTRFRSSHTNANEYADVRPDADANIVADSDAHITATCTLADV